MKSQKHRQMMAVPYTGWISHDLPYLMCCRPQIVTPLAHANTMQALCNLTFVSNQGVGCYLGIFITN